VTYPLWVGQLLSTPTQAVTLLFPWQLRVVPSQQFAVALQRAFSRPPGPFAAGSGATGAFKGAAREARKARSAALGAGATWGRSAAIAGGKKKPKAARNRESPRSIFLITISFLSSSCGKPPRNGEI